jgi:hypothetical protein
MIETSLVDVESIKELVDSGNIHTASLWILDCKPPSQCWSLALAEVGRVYSPEN